jgi:hypothetical protein
VRRGERHPERLVEAVVAIGERRGLVGDAVVIGVARAWMRFSVSVTSTRRRVRAASAVVVAPS